MHREVPLPHTAGAISQTGQMGEVGPNARKSKPNMYTRPSFPGSDVLVFWLVLIPGSLLVPAILRANRDHRIEFLVHHFF